MLLALDTTGLFCSSAVLDGHSLIEASENIGRGHAEHLMAQIEAVLLRADAQWPDIDRIACCTGPGSFTGLRVGLATARGLALALNCPCIGVTVFEAFAFAHAGSAPLCVAMDAKRDQIWLQCFADANRSLAEPCGITSAGASEAVPERVARFAGSAGEMLATKVSGAEVIDPSPSPPIAAIARLGAAARTDLAPPKPLYLRAPDAKVQQAAR
ncbi:MAG: tRNA (adenosine(37)-N6)-threonylcarbamoyltransferase complex dimerization subunit type 1 TsaB [Ahrensia sp.]|nr:tRNA (adenosine(37)-N6)-threonylcarbamoyltransferase complex dimerization subunit type 1 TsaB [Ahrensia sp.]